MIDAEAKKRNKEIYRVTWLGSVVNVALFVFKFIAGIVGNSAAMVADAVHSLSDFVTDIVVIVFVKISSKPADRIYEYGHGKYETLATLIIAVLLLLAGVGIAANGVMEVIDWANGKVLDKPGSIALIAAVVSIVLKELIFRITAKVGKKYRSSVVMANAWHHRSDVWSSVGTMIGIGGAILLGEKWRVLDPLAAIIVSVFIIHVSVDLIKPAVEELMERSLPANTEEKIKEIVLDNPGMRSLHNLHTRRIGNHFAIEFHVRMAGTQSLIQAHYRTMEVERELRKAFGYETHISIHMEPLLSEYVNDDAHTESSLSRKAETNELDPA